jgi:hypothetical protein
MQQRTFTATSVVYSLDGPWLAAGLTDNSIQIWAKTRAVQRLDNGSGLGTGVIQPGIFPDGSVLAAEKNGDIQLWTHLRTLIGDLKGQSGRYGPGIFG